MSTTTISPLRQRMIEDMTARKFGPASQRSHIESCERLAAYLKRSPATATPDDGLPRPCPCCGGRMLIIETFARGATPRHKATPMPPVIRIDTP